MIFLIFMFVFTSIITIFICDGLHKEHPFQFVFMVLCFILAWLGFVAFCDIIEVKIGG